MAGEHGKHVYNIEEIWFENSEQELGVIVKHKPVIDVITKKANGIMGYI